ncbi:MAG: aspartate aminotransferase family protein [Gammaproteobacteria bacterium]
MSDDATGITALLARRERLLGAGSPLFYDEPLHIVRGEGVWLYDAGGRRYLDCYNNVPHVGHCHPVVVEALSRQAATLNIHTRYLHETILDYSERLLATFDDSLDKILYVCTGSEANDQALRIARHATGGQGIICTNLTYHGNTTAVDAISPLFYGKATPQPDVRTIPYPDSYRPPDGRSGAALADFYVDAVAAAIDSFQSAGVRFAGMIVCSIFANEGLPDVPPGFLNRAVELVHAAGGLFIADEVQAGFGRSGRMWGHQLMGFTPDIVTMGKPMGNGHPIAALVARGDLIEQFRRDVMYFNTFGGNPVSCAVAGAVLDVMECDGLIEHARDIGDYVRARFQGLAERHPLIGDIRGHGLWIGVELVRDRANKTPATEETRRIVNRMKERGILMNRIGEFDNVLKMRPPLPFAREHADLLIETIDDVMGETEG